jgi:hypothetical protein
VGQGLTGFTLEVIERSWKFDRFGGRRTANEYLRDPVFFFIDLHKGQKGKAEPIML